MYYFVSRVGYKLEWDIYLSWNDDDKEVDIRECVQWRLVVLIRVTSPRGCAQ